MGTLERNVGRLHGRMVIPRRRMRLARCVLEALPEGCRTIVDVGCGDGAIDAIILAERPGLSITGLEILERPSSRIPVRLFDGKRLPFDDRSHDAVTFIDVLHHTGDPTVLLREAARVARRAVVIKDHLLEGLLAGATLRFMDWVGNRPHGVVLPYNYWRRERWRRASGEAGLNVDVWRERLDLYPWPFTWVFDRRLHFVARLVPAGAGDRRESSS